jgi:hypothetical protein
MITIVTRIGLALATLLLFALATASELPAFDPAETQAATAKLIRALEDPDPSA